MVLPIGYPYTNKDEPQHRPHALHKKINHWQMKNSKIIKHLGENINDLGFGYKFSETTYQKHDRSLLCVERQNSTVVPFRFTNDWNELFPWKS